MRNDIYRKSKKNLKEHCQILPYAKEVVSERFINKNPHFYIYYPYLFSDAFNYYDTEALDKLCIAGFLLYRSLIIKDKLLDEINDVKLAGQHKKYIQIKEICQDEAMQILMGLFDSKSKFWQYFKSRKSELLEVDQIEKKLSYHFNMQNYTKLSDYKSSFGKLAIDAIHVLTNEQFPKTYMQLIKTHKFFSVGFQLFDDTLDIASDFENKQINYCLFLMRNEPEEYNSVLSKVFLVNDYAIETFNKAMLYFARAKETLNGTSLLWAAEISLFYSNIYIKKTTLTAYKKELSKRIELEALKINIPDFSFDNLNPSNTSEVLLKSILGFLAVQAKSDFSEAKHIMYLPPEEGFKGRDTVYVGGVFQKAIIWDVISELNNKFSLNISATIKYGIDDVISQRRRTRNGGWSYLPDAIENAADADDLGQILQLLSHSNNRKLAQKYCTKPIDILLNENQLKNGGIKTWIIPKKNQTKAEQIQSKFNNSKWGDGPNSDVIANFLFGLYVFDKDKYSEQIKRSSRYLADQQNNDGYWLSRWYYREYYGTYICVRILNINKSIFATNLDKAYLYLTLTQNKDGGWGENNISNPLDTAFALLSLLYFDTAPEIISKGIHYLLTNKNEDNSWAAVNFIKPRFIEPYKSTTITTVFVLKALMSFAEDINKGFC